VVLKFGKETALTGAPSPATKLVDKPIFIPLKPTWNIPSVLPDAYWLDYIQHGNFTNKETWFLVQHTRSSNYGTCYALQFLSISYFSSNWRRFSKQNTSIWLKTHTKIVSTHNKPAGYGKWSVQVHLRRTLTPSSAVFIVSNVKPRAVYADWV